MILTGACGGYSHTLHLRVRLVFSAEFRCNYAQWTPNTGATHYTLG